MQPIVKQQHEYLELGITSYTATSHKESLIFSVLELSGEMWEMLQQEVGVEHC